MKYRLDVEHYIDDRLLEPETVIGDEGAVPFRFADGRPMVPSTGMTPLDDEAMAIWKKKFPDTKPQRDPTAAIPVRGTFDTAKQPGASIPAAPVAKKV